MKGRGFKALKTNILPYDGEKLINFGPGFGRTPGHPELNVDRKILQSVRDLLGAFRAGAGPDMGLHLDVNYHFKTEGYLQIAKAVEPFDMTWLEIDTWDPQSLALIRRAAPCPIASLELVCGRWAFRPFLDAYATDVAIIDVIWNGFLELIKIAAMAEAYEVNVAPHNYYGHLCSAVSQPVGAAADAEAAAAEHGLGLGRLRPGARPDRSLLRRPLRLQRHRAAGLRRQDRPLLDPVRSGVPDRVRLQQRPGPRRMELQGQPVDDRPHLQVHRLRPAPEVPGLRPARVHLLLRSRRPASGRATAK